MRDPMGYMAIIGLSEAFPRQGKERFPRGIPGEKYACPGEQGGSGKEGPMKVSDLIGSRREVFAISEDASVLEAAQYLYEKQVRAAGVVDALGKVVGVIAHSDIADKVVRKNQCPAWVKVGEIMTRTLFTVRPQTHFEVGMQLMEQQGIHHLIIVDDNNEFLGMLSVNDLLKAMVSDERERADVLESYVFAVR